MYGDEQRIIDLENEIREMEKEFRIMLQEEYERGYEDGVSVGYSEAYKEGDY